MKIIYGPKGFGKTKIIRDDVNAAAKTAKGNVVFITDKAVNSVGIDFSVRCVNTEEYGIAGKDAFCGFMKGLMAGNRDIEYVFIDGVYKITKTDVPDLEDVFSELEKLSAETGVKFELTVSSAKEDLPKFILKYL